MPEKEEDYLLIEKYLQGDESAFNRIILKYKQRIYWHARRMVGSHYDADEIVQEVFIVLYQKLKNFKFQSSLYTWIYKITATRSINYLRRKQVKKFFSINDDNAKEIVMEDPILKNIEDADKLKKLDGILQKLPSKQREVFILRHFDELSYEEIADITGKSTGGLKANYFHALKKVMELMNEE